MEDAWRQNCRLALDRNSLGSSIPMKAFVVWDVENTWLQNNLIWIGSCREMKGVWYVKNKKTGKFYGLRTQNPPWVAAVTMVPGYLQFNISVWNRKKASERWATSSDAT
jgi:hypothetical protein